MRLKPQERRLIVDDILNLHVFTKMSDQLKTEIAETKSEQQATENQLFLKEELLNSKREHLEALSNVNVSTIDEEKIKQIKAELREQVDIWGDKNTKLEELVIGEEQSTDDLEKQIRKYEQVKNKIMYGVESQKKTYDFFLENSECPTCSQKIEEDFRNSQIESLKQKMMEKKDGVEPVSYTHLRAHET